MIRTVLIVLFVLVLLYIIMNYFFKKSTRLTSLHRANEQQVIYANSLTNNNNTSNYTYSTWFYVDDWNYKFGEEKVLLSRKDQDNNPSPMITLGAMENDITISVACYPNSENSNESIVHKCVIRNFPLQSWVNLVISLYGRTLDVYIDGKLVRTCVLPGVAKMNSESNLTITPDGGFSGWTAKVEYWDDSTNPQQAYNIYKSGFGQNPLSSLFNKYKIKISYLKDNKEQGSLEI
jgi:hypothetical protein